MKKRCVKTEAGPVLSDFNKNTERKLTVSEQTKPKYTSEHELEGRIPTGKAILLGM